MHDSYVDPASGCLRNRLGITDRVELQNAERSASLLREQSIRMHGLPGDYDLPHLQAIHRTIFQDVYPWAGEIRSCELARTHPFCRPEYIEEQATQLLANLAAEDHLSGLERTDFVDRLTHFFSEINAIHPFREGNGRTQRIFFEQLARNAGYVLDWSQTTEHENVEACVAAIEGDLRRLRSLLGTVTS
ncbi:MAG: filamentation induced by cAMP protein Fic [Thermoleophilia bacterium]|nr:filamentation induced by cAMP protein Fic [Thermoleophilia bacterium]